MNKSIIDLALSMYRLSAKTHIEARAMVFRDFHCSM